MAAGAAAPERAPREPVLIGARAGRGPHVHARQLAAALFATLVLSGCGESALLTVAAGSGPAPALPEPVVTLLPTVVIAPAEGWPPGTMPLAARGLRVTALARGLDHPRWLCVLPNGDVLVAETAAPPQPDDATGPKGWAMRLLMRRAGAAVPSADRITLLRDTRGSGVADERTVLLQGLHSPFGMALVGSDLYVAETDAVRRFHYAPGDTRIDGPGVVVVALPAGPINHHWTRNLIASADGRRLYVTVGSNSNVGERGLEAERDRAAVWELDLVRGTHRIYASGLRNPNGLAWEPATGALWVAVNERDELGSDLVPDYMTALQDGAFYGWPWSWYGSHVDARMQPPRPDLVATARVPDYALGPHTASLGLASAAGSALPWPFADGMFVGQHGSWNRRPPSGYKVVFVPFSEGRPKAGPTIDVLTGFLGPEGQAYGRPVGVAIDHRGALLVADDVGNAVWRVTGLR